MIDRSASRAILVSLLLTVCAVALGASAQGAQQPIFQRSLVIDRSVNIFNTSAFDFDLVVTPSFFSTSGALRLFDALQISPNDVGKTFVADRFNSDVFADVAQRLSDRLDEFVMLELREAASDRAEKQGWQESSFFLRGSTSDVPDLAGSRLSSIQLSVDEFVLSGGPAAGGSTQSTTAGASAPPVQVLATLRFYDVPEPSTWTAGLAAMAVLIYSARRTKNSL